MSHAWQALAGIGRQGSTRAGCRENELLWISSRHVTSPVSAMSSQCTLEGPLSVLCGDVARHACLAEWSRLRSSSFCQRPLLSLPGFGNNPPPSNRSHHALALSPGAVRIPLTVCKMKALSRSISLTTSSARLHSRLQCSASIVRALLSMTHLQGRCSQNENHTPTCRARSH